MDEPDTMVDVAQAAEAAGYDSVWTTEHIVLPDPQPPTSPFPPELPFVESTVALTWIAAHTTTIKLGTGLIVLPQRVPAVLAKSLASLDHLSKGRLLFGFGVGYLDPELHACSTPRARRGDRSDEYLAAMRALWRNDAAEFDGDFVSFSGVTANPKPAQAEVHTVVGGHSAAAHRRAVSSAHGWYGFNRDPDTAAADIAALKAAASEIERPAHLGELEISITPPPPHELTARSYAAFAEAGVDRLILYGRGITTRAEQLAFVERHRPANYG